jgi:hypothetical protein
MTPHHNTPHKHKFCTEHICLSRNHASAIVKAQHVESIYRNFQEVHTAGNTREINDNIYVKSVTAV